MKRRYFFTVVILLGCAFCGQVLYQLASEPPLLAPATVVAEAPTADLLAGATSLFTVDSGVLGEKLCYLVQQWLHL